MQVAIPTFGARVAPSFLHCDRMLVADIVAGEVAYTEVVSTGGRSEAERIKLLEDHQVVVLVCGGIDCELTAEIRALGIEVISNVAGETDVVLAHVVRGDLRGGFGISYHPNTYRAIEKAPPGETEPAFPDCGKTAPITLGSS